MCKYFNGYGLNHKTVYLRLFVYFHLFVLYYNKYYTFLSSNTSGSYLHYHRRKLHLSNLNSFNVLMQKLVIFSAVSFGFFIQVILNTSKYIRLYMSKYWIPKEFLAVCCIFICTLYGHILLPPTFLINFSSFE